MGTVGHSRHKELCLPPQLSCSLYHLTPCWYSASPTGANTPWPTATTPPDQPTTPTPASLDLVLGLVGATSVSRVLETSVEELVIDMASALRDSFAQTVTGVKAVL